MQVYWSEGGELMCIATEDSFFVLKYDPEAVEKAKDNPESVSEDGVEDAFDVSAPDVRGPGCVCGCWGGGLSWMLSDLRDW